MTAVLQPSRETAPLEKEGRVLLAQYRSPSYLISICQLASTAILFLAFWALSWYCLRISYWLTLLSSIPAGCFLVKLFIVQHDCGHHSFFRSERANDLVGVILGVVTLTPYWAWRRLHALHHASSGDLDRRGHGDVILYTVDEYINLPWHKRLFYRIHRDPLFLFTLGSFIFFIILQRIGHNVPRGWKREFRSVHLTNLSIALVFAAMCWLIGGAEFLMVHLPVATVAASLGVWLFYVQHNFENTYWEHESDWDFEAAAIHGSSYYDLPKFLQWLTGNIGLHHIHHLDSKIPNYRLQACLEENPEFQTVHRLTFMKSLSTVSLKLWDEKSGKMVGFRRSKHKKKDSSSQV